MSQPANCHPPQGLLAGVKVIDLSRILAGPWATQTLADLGATVIKIESPAGDDTRKWGPPFLRDAEGKETAAYFLACNRGKESITVDFNDAEQLAALKALINEADVVVENHKVGGLAAFGLDYQSVVKLKRDLIYCSITGFGQTGPDAAQAGYDAMIQARGGLMSITGDAHGEPVKVGVAITDLMTGMYAATAICAALYRKQISGMGEYIDLALLDVQAAMLANQAMNYLVGGEVPGRLGSAHPNIVPYQVFNASDGNFMLAVGNDRQFEQLTQRLDLAALATDEAFSTNAARVKNRARLVAQINAKTELNTRKHWLNVLAEAGIPCGPVQDIQEVMNDAQLKARGMIIEPQGQAITAHASIRSPIHLTQHKVRTNGVAPFKSASILAKKTHTSKG